jgi:hypothetical protein
MSIIFFGTPEFALPSLKALIRAGERINLVVTQTDKVKGRGHTLTPPPIKVAAQEAGLKVAQPVNLRDETFLEELASGKPEFIIVVAYGKILPKMVLGRTLACAPAMPCAADVRRRPGRPLARRTPHWIGPDHLTALGLASLAGAGLSYWCARWNPAGLLWVILFLALNWLGDSLDGTLARVRNRQRPRYGFYIDHVVDAFGTLFLLSGLAFSGYMSERVAAGLLIAGASVDCPPRISVSSTEDTPSASAARS